MYLCCLLPQCDILSYCFGTILPICAESVVKPETSKQTNKQFTTTSITLSFNKIQNGDILVPADPGQPGKRPLKWREREGRREGEGEY